MADSRVFDLDQLSAAMEAPPPDQPGGVENTAPTVLPESNGQAHNTLVPQSDGEPVRVSLDSGYDDNDGDSTLSTTPIHDHAKEFREENGRTYHGYKSEKRYLLPNDVREEERLNIQHHSLRLAIGDKLFLAPIEQLTEVFDVGAGTGIWAVSMGDAYPAARIEGIDLSPIQPQWVPPNVTFLREDLDDDWHSPGRFDLIHTREMNGIAIKDWTIFFERAYASMKPGGWVECQECDKDIRSDDNTIPKDSVVLQWLRLREQGFEKAGMTGRCYPENMAHSMRKAGFINVNVLSFKMPIGPWAKDPMLHECGSYTLGGLLDHVQGLSLRVFTEHLGWTQEELEVLLMDVRKEWKRGDIHSYYPIYVVYGQKPPRANEDMDFPMSP
ncbi:hypothetical protein H2200_009266 [Cladophialophora chaetospira]|uniref:Methyltransferase n=1 Tax=Cladophialophora chaetospira TaxID=386627 RepID=A0AA38X443_9EURO|nr:hypothetical protein H2200_009266 [Cladophialophora chaetospira]